MDFVAKANIFCWETDSSEHSSCALKTLFDICLVYKLLFFFGFILSFFHVAQTHAGFFRSGIDQPRLSSYIYITPNATIKYIHRY